VFISSAKTTSIVADTLCSAVCCSDWTSCTANAQTAGCTYYDMFTEALQYLSWSDFNDYDLDQRHYREAVDSLRHFCTNIYPGMMLTNYQALLDW